MNSKSLTSLAALTAALCTGAAMAAPVSFSQSWAPNQYVSNAAVAKQFVDINSWAQQTLGTDRFKVVSGRLRLSFTDDVDTLIDRGVLGYDGQTTTQTAYRGSRDGVSGIITQRVVTDWQARGFENEAEQAVVDGVGLRAVAGSASRQWVVDGPVTEIGRDWSGWTRWWWGHSGTETIRQSAERNRHTSYDGDFSLDVNLGRQALDDIGADGRWGFNVGAQLGDFLWRSARLDLSVEGLPPSQVVPEPAGWALTGAALACVGFLRRRTGGQGQQPTHPSDSPNPV